MKTTLTYSAPFTLTITAVNGDVVTLDASCQSLDSILEYVNMISNDETPLFHGNGIALITVCDSTTAEIVAECRPDDELDFDNPNYDPDWGYNDDMGFDPYLGCYTDDC
jgi:hypothetical protein